MLARYQGRHPVEHVYEVMATDGSHLAERVVVPCYFSDRGHFHIRQTTGHNGCEILEIGVYVESKAMTRDPAADVDSNRSNLPILDPHTQLFAAPTRFRINAQLRQGCDKNPLQVMNISSNVTSVGVEIDDRIANQLPRSVVGDLTASITFHHLDTPCIQPLGIGQNICVAGIPAQRIDVRVLQKKQNITLPTSTHCIAYADLESLRGRVGNPAEKAPLELAFSPV